MLCCVHAIRDGDGVDDVAPPTITEKEGYQLLDQYSLTQDEQQGTTNETTTTN